ncbi:hypothetical protein IID24_04355 [Patescibacteria group bacterium]|nr:hypothetical protein [Patescibacteria group bacterium]
MHQNRAGLSESETVIDLSFLKFREVIRELDDNALSRAKSRLVSALSRAQQELDQATKKWQKHGEGLPNWYAARFNLTSAIEKKLTHLSSLQQLRTRKDIYAQELRTFQRTIMECGYEELKLIIAYLHSHLDVRQRRQRIQIVEGYLALNKPARVEQSQTETTEFARTFLWKAKVLLGEEVYAAILNETQKVVQVSDVGEDCIP